MPQSARQGISYTVIARAISMGLEFGNSVLLTRLLGPGQYGLYSIFFTGTTSMSSITDMGINSAVTTYVAQADAEKDTESAYSILASALLLHSILVICLWAIALIVAKPMAVLLLDGDQMLFWLLALAFPMQLWAGDFIGALYGLRELKFVAGRSLLQSAVLVGLNLLLVWAAGGELRVAAGVYALTQFLMLAWLIRSFIKLIRQGRLSVSRPLHIKSILRFSLPLSGIYPVDSLIQMAPILLVKALGGQADDTNERVAFVSLALLLATVARNMLMSVVKSGYGYMANWYAQRKFDRLNKYLTWTHALIMAAYAIIALLAVLGLPTFVRLVYGQEYARIDEYILLALALSFIRSTINLRRTTLYTLTSTLVVLKASLAELALYATLISLLYRPSHDVNWGRICLVLSAITASVNAIVLLVSSAHALHRAETTSQGKQPQPREAQSK